MMRENTCTEEKAMDLLNQLEFILESDPLIDEVGFIHPSQFVTLGEEADSSHPLSEHGNLNHETFDVNTLEQKNTNFWNRDHKLGISTQVLLPLFGAAKEAFVAAVRQYKTFTSLAGKLEGQNITCCSSPCVSLESEVMKHSRSLLLLSCDFGTAWNSRKLIVSKKQQLSMFINELLLSELVLSYSPKSEQAWTHRRWVIKMIAGKCSTLEDIIAKESELVEKIAERSKMNYRAWNHRCWLVSYMTRAQIELQIQGSLEPLLYPFFWPFLALGDVPVSENVILMLLICPFINLNAFFQMLHELKKSRVWAGLHVADNSCFHYCRRLMVGILENWYKQEVENSCNIDNYQILEEELDSNEMLIKRYIGREALWLHRRFLSLHWIRHITSNLHGAHHSEQKLCSSNEIGIFIDRELCLLKSCLTIHDSEFEDFQAQATYSAFYVLWLTKQIPQSPRIELQAKLKAAVNLKALIKKTCPDKSSLWDCLFEASDEHGREN